MFTALSTLVAPTQEPVSVDTARQHIRVDHQDDDNLLALYISVARELAENYLGRALLTQQLRYALSESPPGAQWPLTLAPVILPLWLPFPLTFGRPLQLPRYPVQSIDRVAVSHSGQLDDTVLSAAGDYTADLTGAPARLLLAPSAQPQFGQHVAVDFTAGYGLTPDAMPRSIVVAVLFGTAFLYENRGDEGAEMPAAFYALLTPHRLVSFG